jgi:hypothetical protein
MTKEERDEADNKARKDGSPMAEKGAAGDEPSVENAAEWFTATQMGNMLAVPNHVAARLCAMPGKWSRR